MTAELAVRTAAPDGDLFRVARAFAQSGYFKDSKEEAQCVVRILAGRELGFGPFASMSGVYIIEGKPTVSAGLMATAIENSGRYGYGVAWEPDEQAPTACAITFHRLQPAAKGGRPLVARLGVSRFSLEDAQRAGLLGKGTRMWERFPRNMLFSRAMSNGARWYCAGVFGVGAVYTPEELGEEVDEEGAPVTGSPLGPRSEMGDPVMDVPPPDMTRITRTSADTAEVRLPDDDDDEGEVSLAPLDYRATLEWLRRLPAADLYNPAQRTALRRLLKRIVRESVRLGGDPPPRERGMSDARYAVVAVGALAERAEAADLAEVAF